MKIINPYLNFDGTAEEAFKFYESVFGEKIIFLQRFKDVPPGASGSNFSKEDQNRVMHVAIRVGKNVLMGSDFPKSMSKDFRVGNNFNVSITTDSKEETDRIFNKLSKGGKISMPLADMFWGEYFGGLTDKFGIKWMISFAKNPIYPTQDNEVKGTNMEEMKDEMITIRDEKNSIIVTRVFDAPIEKVWKAWTNPREVKKWWGPKDFTAPVVKADFRVSGSFLYCMRGSIGVNAPVRDYCNTGEFLQITPMKKIVTSVSFSDKKGNPVKASYYEMPGKWPMSITYTVTFEEVKGKTRLTIEGTGIPKEMKENAQMGWEQSLDKLNDSIQELQEKRLNN
jgi:uncharacterized glyoxalase superfamily protein PhnB/uncharacterized protein YndB with AHSA1/START domain